ncbi:TIGR03960 family B12-binding radical SAM protein [Desulforhabdus amnigena]|uniref:B12-binding protein n=1 Tax=Desulforhabdus amnigena TaxID=40218 RepID=A0A9W6FT16_9BACT|nr:TIGR03960 family B12-binding radical SAM protein [Desulforhabdus amnigena]GLI34713.1 B12-binding protein [Desulforhabdus amnigena]
MLERSLYGIEKPGRYIGGEINAYRKSFDEARVRFALAFPDVYEVGLSHLGLRLLYHVLNGMEHVMADRVYAPWQDFESRLRELAEPLGGVESEHPLDEFDFVGFSLQYELSYSNILTILDLGGIPLEARDRNLEHPWVIGGGPCAFNPEPIAEFFDFFVLGEAEEVLVELVDAFEKWKASKGTRQEFLENIRRIEGIYVPSFFDISYRSDGVIAAVEPRFSDYTSVRKRLILDLDDDAPIPERPLVPMLDIVHNRLGLEIARGCTRGCRFCQASFIYRPVRERSPQVLLDCAEKALANSGFEELSLLSLSTGDYCRIQPLLAALMERFANEKVAVSFPSMRVGTLTPELMELIRKVRKTGFTLAPEAGSDRLRRVINKGILEEDLLAAAESAFGLGWRLIKLYFMTGLPTETEADLDALVELCMKVWSLAKPSKSSVNVSVSTFVPKPQTPFQWAPQIPKEAVESRLGELKVRLKKPGLRLKWHHPDHSILEGVFARGDRRLGKTLKRAWELGVRFDGWTELFRRDLWDRAFEETGMDPAFYSQRERSREEILPWDHLSSGVEKGFLWKEYEKALAEEATPDCRWDRCSLCGVCDHKTVQPRLHRDEIPLTAGPGKSQSPGTDEGFPYRFRYSKLGKARFFGQLEVAQAFSRAVRRAGLPAAYSKGFHPHVKLSFADALPLGMESTVAEARLTLTERLDPLVVKSGLNQHLPEGLAIEDVRRSTTRTMQPDKRRATYRVSGLNPFEVRSILDGWSDRLEEQLVKKTKKGEKRATLREVLLDVRELDATTLEMDLLEGTQMFFRPMAILQHLLGEPLEHFAGCRICKTAISRLAGVEEREDVGRAHHQW